MRTDIVLARVTWIAVLLLGVVPLLVGTPAALEDWPSHVARDGILAQLLRGDPYWAAFYEINTFFVPNIAADLGILGLHAIGISIEDAARIVLGCGYALFVGGACALARARRVSDPLQPLCAAVLFFNGALMDGFVNYMIGMGMAFWWLAACAVTPGNAARAAIATLGAVAVYFCHIIAAGLYFAVLGLWALSDLLATRDWRLTSMLRHVYLVVAALPVLVLYALAPAAGIPGPDDPQDRFSFAGGPGLIGILKAKLFVFVHPFLDGSGLVGAVILVLGGAVFAATMLVFVRTGRVRLAPLPGWGIMVAGLAVLYLLVPNHIGDGLGLDYRLPPMVMMVAILMLRVEWRDRRSQLICLSILLALSAARSAWLVREAVENQRVYRGFALAAQTIPADSALLSGVGTPRAQIPWYSFWAPPTEYMGTLAAARGVFVPSVFAIRSQHPLALRGVFRGWHPQFDISDPTHLATVRAKSANFCTKWLALGHAGSVYMVVVYPSAFSDTAFPPAARGAAGTGFRIVDMCIAG